MSWRFVDLGFVSPWKRNHCVPLAFTAARGGDAEFAISLAESAYSTPHPQWRDGTRLLNANGGAVNARIAIESWAKLAGVEIVGEFRPIVRYDVASSGFYSRETGRPIYRAVKNGMPTIARFLKEQGRRGRWIVFTERHAQAVVNGRVRGWHKRRARVQAAFRITVKEVA